MPDWFVSRRNLLATIGGTGAIAGCAGRSDGDASSSAPDDRTNESSKETTPEQTPKTIHVSKDGAEDNSGAKDAPLASIQTAVERAQPGQTIKVQPGEYREFIQFRTDGTPDNPITLTGPPEAVLKPPKDVDHGTIGVGASHVHITGLTTRRVIYTRPSDHAQHVGRRQRRLSRRVGRLTAPDWERRRCAHQ
jgi:hypothetical protein